MVVEKQVYLKMKNSDSVECQKYLAITSPQRADLILATLSIALEQSRIKRTVVGASHENLSSLGDRVRLFLPSRFRSGYTLLNEFQD